LLFLIPFIGFSQANKSIDGVLGIKFGNSKAATIASIKAHGGKLDQAHSNADVKMFMNVKFGQSMPIALIVKFINDKFYIATFLFKADVDSNTIQYYNNLISSLNDSYGMGSITKTFSKGYTDGDGKEIEAIEDGSADYHTTWNSGKGSIVIAINSKLYIGLTYQDNN